jgi:hypothetical protein
MIDALCTLESNSRIGLSAIILNGLRGEKRGDCPCYSAVMRRFGSWKTVRALMDEWEGAPAGQFFGEIGALAYDPVRDLLQCHSCGVWLRSLHATHLATHDLDADGYRVKYRIGHNRPLCVPTVVPSTEFKPASIRGWSEDRMIAVLRRLQVEHGGCLAEHHLLGLPRTEAPSASAVISRFGSWAIVCKILGQPFGYHPPARPKRRWTDQELIECLVLLEREIGEPVGVRTLWRLRHQPRSQDVPSVTTLLRRFGTWSEIHRRAKEAGGLGSPPRGRSGSNIVRNARGSFARDGEPARRWTKHEVLEALLRLEGDTGRAVSLSTLRRREFSRSRRRDLPSFHTVENLFGSADDVRKALEAAGGLHRHWRAGSRRRRAD